MGLLYKFWFFWRCFTKNYTTNSECGSFAAIAWFEIPTTFWIRSLSLKRDSNSFYLKILKKTYLLIFFAFYVRQQNASRVLAIVYACVRLSVCLSVCLSHSWFLSKRCTANYDHEIFTVGCPKDSSLSWQNIVPVGAEFPLERRRQRGVPPKKTLFCRYWLV